MLEIGPGRGALTALLVARGVALTAIEKDRDLLPELRERFPQVRLLEGDALEVDWPTAATAGQPVGGVYKVIGNIPYNITSPLIDKALTPPLPARIVFLVQREVADRVVARPGTKAYGGLSVGVQTWADATKLFVVPRGAFVPAPNVDSAVLRLTPRATPGLREADARAFRQLVTSLFGARRKQLGRALRQITGQPAERVVQVLSRLGIRPEERPEQLSPTQFVALFQAVVDGLGAGD